MAMMRMSNNGPWNSPPSSSVEHHHPQAQTESSAPSTVRVMEQHHQHHNDHNQEQQQQQQQEQYQHPHNNHYQQQQQQHSKRQRRSRSIDPPYTLASSTHQQLQEQQQLSLSQPNDHLYCYPYNHHHQNQNHQAVEGGVVEVEDITTTPSGATMSHHHSQMGHLDAQQQQLMMIKQQQQQLHYHQQQQKMRGRRRSRSSDNIQHAFGSGSNRISNSRNTRHRSHSREGEMAGVGPTSSATARLSSSYDGITSGSNSAMMMMMKAAQAQAHAHAQKHTIANNCNNPTAAATAGLVAEAIHSRVQKMLSKSRLTRKSQGIKFLHSSEVGRVTKVLGAGAFSQVTRVEQQTQPSGPTLSYACKSLKKELMVDTKGFVTAATELAYEAHMLSSFTHPNIIKIRGWASNGIASFEDGSHDSFFLLLDLLEETLDQRVDRYKVQLKPKNEIQQRYLLVEKMSILQQVASALDYIHSQGVVYSKSRLKHVCLCACACVCVSWLSCVLDPTYSNNTTSFKHFFFDIIKQN